ncbi:MAG: methylenetetrahydrofolate reductase C-terminal domain-containing protein [Deltaproteobacteria bacterium]|nr:methylenetetrahydrofolate reductase C-terminal domain-containing protein [Deltaproteobacteria bacterium]
MIIAEQKPLAEIQDMVAPYRKILLVGCGTCMTFCSAGGPEQVNELAGTLLSENKNKVIEKTTIPRQCAVKFIDRLENKVGDHEAILSMACGNGVQAVASRFPDKPVLPALNTQFIGVDCILWRTGGICPVTRCAKSLLNGACGGASGGKCEVSKDCPCAWQEIYHALKRLNMLHYLKEKPQVKDWPIHPGRVVREDLRGEVLS